jgi:hypothetical protein
VAGQGHAGYRGLGGFPDPAHSALLVIDLFAIFAFSPAGNTKKHCPDIRISTLLICS